MSTFSEDSYTPENQGLHPEMTNFPLDLREVLSPTMRAYWLHDQRHTLAWLVETGRIIIPDGERIYFNERGSLAALGGDAPPAERRRLPLPEVVFGTGDQERLQEQRGMSHILVIEEEPSVIADQIVETIANAPTMRLMTWNRVLGTLRTAPPPRHTPASLARFLRSAIRQEDSAWQHMEALTESISVEALRRMRTMGLILRIQGLMGLESVNEDALDSMSDAQPDLFNALIEPLIRLHRRVADSTDESETLMEQRIRMFKHLCKGLMEVLREGKLASVMREYLGRLEGPNRVQRLGEAVIIDLTQECEFNIIDLT